MESFQSLSQSRSRSSAFVSKVISLFGLAILVTAAGVYLGYNYWLESILGNQILFFGLFIAEFALILTSRMWSKTEPLNYFLFLAFTFISGLTVVPLITYFVQGFGQGFALIYNALFATTATFMAAALIGYRSEKSLSGWTGFLTTGLIGMLIVGLMGIFFPWGNTMEMLYSGFGVLIFTGFVAVDINRLRDYPEDEYIQAAMALYLDLFNLFIFILRLTGALSKR